MLGLAGVVVLTVALGIIFGGWLWWTAAIAGGLTIAYLVALRTQVRQEQQLRARRIAQLRRARLGVRSAQDEELAIPRSCVAQVQSLLRLTTVAQTGITFQKCTRK